MESFHRLLNLGKFKILEFETVANVNTEGQQCDCHFRNNTRRVILNKRVVAANVNNSAQHKYLLCENPPPKIGGG